MARKRQPIQLGQGTYAVLMDLRERIYRTEGRRLTVDQTVQVALAGLTDAQIPDAIDAKFKRMVVNIVGQLLTQVRPDLAKQYRGMAFNEADGMAELDLSGDAERVLLMAKDPADMVRN